jgi:putative hemolysin
MIIKLDSRIGALLFTVLGIMALIGAAVSTAVGQGAYEQGVNVSGQGINTSGPDSAYCTGNGYYYTTISGVNNGKAICQFPDGKWCDAHAYFTGDCAASTNVSYNPGLTYNPNLPYNLNLYNTPVAPSNPYMYYNPYMYNNPQDALDIADATKTCQQSGGVVQRVHTSYGDVSMCVFPDGSYIDLMGLYSATYGGSVPFGDNWYYYAYSWLNAP